MIRLIIVTSVMFMIIFQYVQAENNLQNSKLVDTSCIKQDSNRKFENRVSEFYELGICYVGLAKVIDLDEEYDEFIAKRFRKNCILCYQYDFKNETKPRPRSWGGRKEDVPYVFEAAEYFKKAANLDHLGAKFQLGKVLLIIALHNKQVSKRQILNYMIHEDQEFKRCRHYSHPDFYKREYCLTYDDFLKYVDLVNAKNYPTDFSEEITGNVEYWFRAAAEAGHIQAQFYMGALAYHGIGRDINLIESYAWYALAVAQNPPFGKERRDQRAVEITEEELYNAEGLAMEYMRKYSKLYDRPSHTMIH